MKIKKENIELEACRRIVLNKAVLKEPNFQILKRMLDLDEDTTSVHIYFKKIEVFKKAENSSLL